MFDTDFILLKYPTNNDLELVGIVYFNHYFPIFVLLFLL